MSNFSYFKLAMPNCDEEDSGETQAELMYEIETTGDESPQLQICKSVSLPS